MAQPGGVEGMDQILQNLQKLKDKLENSAETASHESAKFLWHYAQVHHGSRPRKAARVYNRETGRSFNRAAGIGWGNITGQLQGSIDAKSYKIPRGYRIVLRATAPYAKYLENPNAKFIKSRRQVKGQGGGPWEWLWPAVANNQTTIINIFRQNMKI